MFVIPEIDREKALEILAKKPRPFTRKRNLLKIELLYLPSFLFLVRIKPDKGNRSVDYVVVEAIHGEFALMEKCDYSPEPFLPCRIYDFILPPAEAEAIALNQYERILLKKSLKNKSLAVVESIELEKQFYYPYWIGYFRRKRALDFDVIDGMSGNHQGPKMRPVFIELLLQKKEDGANPAQRKNN